MSVADQRYSKGQQVYIVQRFGVNKAITEYLYNQKLPPLGKIVNITLSDNLSHHGSPMYEWYYTVVSEVDGRTYMVGTPESRLEIISQYDFLKRLKSRKTDNLNKINKYKSEIQQMSSENNKIDAVISKANLLGLI